MPDLAVIAPSGYTVVGLYQDENLTTPFVDEIFTVYDSNLTLYAEIEQINYTLKFNSNGGSECSDIINVYLNDTVQLPSSSLLYNNGVWENNGVSYNFNSSIVFNPEDFAVNGNEIIFTAQWTECAHSSKTYTSDPIIVGSHISRCNSCGYTFREAHFWLKNPITGKESCKFCKATVGIEIVKPTIILPGDVCIESLSNGDIVTDIYGVKYVYYNGEFILYTEEENLFPVS